MGIISRVNKDDLAITKTKEEMLSEYASEPYRNGYEHGYAAGVVATFNPRLRWINVNKELPQIGKRVLVYRCNYSGDDDNRTMIGYVTPSDKFVGNQGELIDDDLYPHTLVTHWMPLIDPPEKPE